MQVNYVTNEQRRTNSKIVGARLVSHKITVGHVGDSRVAPTAYFPFVALLYWR